MTINVFVNVSNLESHSAYWYILSSPAGVRKTFLYLIIVAKKIHQRLLAQIFLIMSVYTEALFNDAF